MSVVFTRVELLRGFSLLVLLLGLGFGPQLLHGPQPLQDHLGRAGEVRVFGAVLLRRTLGFNRLVGRARVGQVALRGEARGEAPRNLGQSGVRGGGRALPAADEPAFGRRHGREVLGVVRRLRAVVRVVVVVVVAQEGMRVEEAGEGGTRAGLQLGRHRRGGARPGGEAVEARLVGKMGKIRDVGGGGPLLLLLVLRSPGCLRAGGRRALQASRDEVRAVRLLGLQTHHGIIIR